MSSPIRSDQPGLVQIITPEGPRPRRAAPEIPLIHPIPLRRENAVRAGQGLRHRRAVAIVTPESQERGRINRVGQRALNRPPRPVHRIPSFEQFTQNIDHRLQRYMPAPDPEVQINLANLLETDPFVPLVNNRYETPPPRESTSPVPRRYEDS